MIIQAKPDPWPKQLAEVLHPVPGSSRLMELEEPFPVVYCSKGTWWRFWLTPPWRYDVASVPRLFWLFVSPFELVFEPPGSHDWLIEHKGVVLVDRWSLNYEEWVNEFDYTHMTRRAVDAFLAMKMREKEIPKLKRRAAYCLVRNWSLMKGADWV